MCLFESFDQEERIIPVYAYESFDSRLCRCRAKRDQQYITGHVTKQGVIGCRVFVVEDNFIHSSIVVPRTFAPNQRVNNQVRSGGCKPDQMFANFSGGSCNNDVSFHAYFFISG